MDPIATLQQLDDECTAWSNQHAHSCNLLASLLNITRQREQTLAQWQTQTTKQERASSASSSSSVSSLLAPSSLQLLIHKQSLEIESVLQQLYETIQVFQRVVQAMITLERQTEASIQRIAVPTLSRTSSASSSPALPTPERPPQPVAYSSLIDTAEISPLEVLDWVARIRAMYAQELYVKQSQIHPSMTGLDRFETLAELQRNWGLQKRLDFGLEQEIVERIKVYRRVREFSTRTA
ncbi:hypothetical protein EMPS_04940 [Entomortierella parvispora]|uniref:Uncharacterized protein n=1 Tax=Entomortierella parvispora TaxID=205924 RepID=A0A9P3H9J1_9FUNG|nr:hypothetical protein EMPS_04940 [Entomortierella parvispora]